MKNTQPIRCKHTIEFYESRNNSHARATVELPSLQDAEQYLERRGWKKAQELWAEGRWEKLGIDNKWQYAKIVPTQPRDSLRSMF